MRVCVCVCRKVTFHLVTTREPDFFAEHTYILLVRNMCGTFFSPFRPYLLAFQQCHRQPPCAIAVHTYRASQNLCTGFYLFLKPSLFLKANGKASEQHTHAHNFKNFVHFHRSFFLARFFSRIFQSQCKLWCVNVYARTSLLESFWGSKRDKLYSCIDTNTSHFIHTHTRTHTRFVNNTTTGAPTEKKWVLLI